MSAPRRRFVSTRVRLTAWYAALLVMVLLARGISVDALARNRLMAERGRLKTNEKAELIIRAWNASRRGDKVASLPIKGGALPTVER